MKFFGVFGRPPLSLEVQSIRNQIDAPHLKPVKSFPGGDFRMSQWISRLVLGFLLFSMTEGAVLASASGGDPTRPCGVAEVCLAVRKSRVTSDSLPPIDFEQDVVLDRVNGIWSQCGIGFFWESERVLDLQYLPVQPKLEYPEQLVELTWILPEFRQLEVVYTKKWYGQLGGDSRVSVRAGVALNSIEYDTRADLPAVVFINEPFRNSGDVLAHELGHVLGLVHREVPDPNPKHFRPGMMFPSMGSHRTVWRFSEEECLLARKTARERWHEALR